jgi:hypothetical protein
MTDSLRIAPRLIDERGRMVKLPDHILAAMTEPERAAYDDFVAAYTTMAEVETELTKLVKQEIPRAVEVHRAWRDRTNKAFPPLTHSQLAKQFIASQRGVNFAINQRRAKLPSAQ